ncbi:MAG: hypothetical protein JST07_00585 [Bacteroidetes bacterium]|nr:hypothetical protein [Bacteroidota bacterium]
MKNNITKIILLSAFLRITFLSNAQITSPTNAKDSLTALNFIKYEQMPVDSFLAVIPTSYTQLKISGRHFGYASYLGITYSNDIYVEVYVRNFKYLPNRYDKSLNWDITLFRKEDIAFIVLFEGSNCLKGCLNIYPE